MTEDYDIAAYCRSAVADYRRLQKLAGPTVEGSVYAAALEDAANEVAYCILIGGERAGKWLRDVRPYWIHRLGILRHTLRREYHDTEH